MFVKRAAISTSVAAAVVAAYHAMLWLYADDILESDLPCLGVILIFTLPAVVLDGDTPLELWMLANACFWSTVVAGLVFLLLGCRNWE